MRLHDFDIAHFRNKQNVSYRYLLNEQSWALLLFSVYRDFAFNFIACLQKFYQALTIPVKLKCKKYFWFSIDVLGC